MEHLPTSEKSSQVASYTNSLSTNHSSQLTVVPTTEAQLSETLKYWDQDRKRIFWLSLLTKLIDAGLLVLALLSITMITIYIAKAQPEALKYWLPSLVSGGGLLWLAKKLVGKKPDGP